MEKGIIAKGEILLASNGQRWIVGSFISVNGMAANFEAAPYDGKTPIDYPAILQIVALGDKPLPGSFQFYLDHANPNKPNNCKRVKHVQHPGIPVLLGAGSLKINNQNYKFIVIERHGKDLWSLFLDHGKNFEAHTAYKITLQIINVLKYLHSKSYVHGDIRASNIVVDVATQNRIYLMNGHSASYTVSDDQVDPDKTCNGGAVLWSRDAHMGVSTERGDMEMLFYNLVQLLGIELPWAKNSKNPSLMLEEKKDAFADIDKFLKNWSSGIEIPIPVAEFMKLLASVDVNDKPMYSSFVRVLTKGLRKLYHVPTGNLEFSISSVPFVEQIEENFDQTETSQRRRKKRTSLPNVGVSVNKLASIIAENCKHEGEVNLWETGPGSLIDTIYRLIMRKRSPIVQNKIAEAWDRDKAELKTTTRRLWKEKALKAKRTANEAAITENKHDISGQDSTCKATASSQKSTNVLNHSSPGASNSQSHREAMSPGGIPPQEQTASFHLSNISPLDVRRTALSPSPSRWSGNQNSLIRPSTSGYSSRSSIQGDSHSEAKTFSRTSEQFFDKERSRVPEVDVARVKRETCQSDEEVTECQWSDSVGCEPWQDRYNKLNAWLKMREQNFSAFGSIPSEPQMIVDQVQQVWVLLDESHRSLLLRRLKNTELPPDSDDVQGLESLLEQVEHRWWDLQARLEKRGKELGDACRQKLRDALQDVSNDLNQLSLDNDPEEQRLSKIETLAGQLEGLRRTLLANATAVAEQLCQALRNQAYTSDLRVQLRSVKSLHSNLQQKIAIRKAEVESSLEDGHQFDDSCKEMNVWLVKELANILEKPLVSTDRTILQQQHDYYKVEHQRIMDNETHVMRLLEMGRNRLRPQNSTQQRFLESIESQWNCLIKQSFDIFNKLKTCVEICGKFNQTQDLFLCWLNEAENRLESVKPTSLEDIGKQLKQLSAFRHEVDEKLIQFEQYIDLSRTFIGICDVDEDDVLKNEISSTKAKWTKLNRDMLNRLQLLKDMNEHYEDFKRSLLDLQEKVESYVKESTSHDALEAAAKDSKLLNRTRVLEREMTYLQRPLAAVYQQAEDLVHEVQKLGIDADSLFKLVNHIAVCVNNSKAKLVQTREEILEHDRAKTARETEERKPAKDNINVKIEQSSVEIVTLDSSDEDEDNLTTAAAKQFCKRQELFLRWLSQAESKLQSAKPASLDDIGKQLQELSALRDEVREKSEFEQLIGICDVTRDDLLKNELNVAKDRYTKLNHDLLDRLRSFEDINKSFAVFNQSLLDLQQKIEPFEKESTLHDALEAAAKDTKLLHRLRELETEMTSLQKPLDDVRQQADGLVLKACEQGINVSHLFDAVNLAAARIENCKTKFGNTRIDIFKQEHVRLLEEIQADTPAETEDSREAHSHRKQDRDSESNNPRCNKKRRASPSRKRSRSKDLISSCSKIAKNSDGSKSHKNYNHDDPRLYSELSPSKPTSSTYSKDTDNSDQNQHCQKPYFHRGPFRRTSKENSAYGQAMSACGMIHGWEPNAVRGRERQKGEDDTNEEHVKSDERSKKNENTENQLERDWKPLVNYSSHEDSDDEQ